MKTISELLQWATQSLPLHDYALLEAQVLLAYVLHCERSYLYAWPEKEVTQPQLEQFEALIVRRQQHEPIAYLIGQKEFWSLSFQVTRDTLIPRFETELLVQKVLEILLPTPLDILDVGTGCGNIACALAHERNQWHITATDVSAAAIAVAKRNAKNLNLNDITFLQSEWLSALPDKYFDAIISNPPYIRQNDVHLIHGDLLYEPQIALTPGIKGLEAFEILIAQAAQHLKPNGLLALEHGFDQAEAVSSLLQQSAFHNIQTFQDLAGLSRVTVGYFCNDSGAVS